MGVLDGRSKEVIGAVVKMDILASMMSSAASADETQPTLARRESTSKIPVPGEPPSKGMMPTRVAFKRSNSNLSSAMMMTRVRSQTSEYSLIEESGSRNIEGNDDRNDRGLVALRRT